MEKTKIIFVMSIYKPNNEYINYWFDIFLNESMKNYTLWMIFDGASDNFIIERELPDNVRIHKNETNKGKFHAIMDFLLKIKLSESHLKILDPDDLFSVKRFVEFTEHELIKGKIYKMECNKINRTSTNIKNSLNGDEILVENSFVSKSFGSSWTILPLNFGKDKNKKLNLLKKINNMMEDTAFALFFNDGNLGHEFKRGNFYFHSLNTGITSLLDKAKIEEYVISVKTILNYMQYYSPLTDVGIEPDINWIINKCDESFEKGIIDYEDYLNYKDFLKNALSINFKILKKWKVKKKWKIKVKLF